MTPLNPSPEAAASINAATAAPRLLQGIHAPADIRKLSPAELKELAGEIRATILEVVSKNSAGGHLASSLGSVELTVALHYVYRTPEDRVVFDTGHQGYAHKLLTGRFSRFETLRHRDGISGFLRRSESPYDVFGAGHAGTSISAALGIAQARDVKGEDYKVVAVIGDGSMTCGLPFEGLNNAGHTETDLLVVLNDNEMSISENVGALSKYFNQVVQSRFYNQSKKGVKELVKKAPGGERIAQAIHKLEESTKGLILPSLFFEDLGFRYVGPVDGHDLDGLIATLANIREHYHGPVLLHAVTTKGQGYKLAEGDPIFWHAPPNFTVETGECRKSSARTWTHVAGEQLVEMADADPRVVAITAAMCTGTGLVPFRDRFPKRFFDVGIAEGHAVTAAAGMALEGLRPYVTIYSSFLQRGFDNVMHDVALQRLPVVFLMDRSGLVGFDGPTHHGLLDIAYMRVLPGMVVMAPKDDAELRDMMLTANGYLDGPVAIRYPRGGVAAVDCVAQPKVLEMGKAEVIRHGAGPAAILSYGHVFGNVMSAAGDLASEGVDVAVVNARFAKPMDKEMLAEVAARYPILLSVEDHSVVGGFGSAVNEALVEMGLAAHCEIIGVPDRFIEHGDQASQQEEAGISAARIAARVREAVARREASLAAGPGRAATSGATPAPGRSGAVGAIA